MSITSLALSSCFRLRQELQRPHIVQSVRHPHDDDPGVGGPYRRHRLRHRASLSSADLTKRRVLGHHRRDCSAEPAPQFGECSWGVLESVVQYSSAQHLVVGAEPGENRRNLYRVGDVRVATPADLALMTARRDIVGSSEQLDVGTRAGRSKGRMQPCKGVSFGLSRLCWTAVHGGTSGMPDRLAIRAEQRLARA
jgi:hypothetical protein